MTRDHRAWRLVKSTVLYAAITIAAAVVLFPFVWMLITAFKQPGTEFDPEFFPKAPTLENFRRVFTEFGFDCLRGGSVC